MRRVLLFVAGLILFVPIYGQMDSIVVVDEVIIRENRIQVPLSKRPSSVTIIGREQILSRGTNSISGILSLSSGVDIRQRGVNGIQSDIALRGSSFDQVVILINGIRMSDPQTGHHSLNLPVDIAAIDHIEILKGPAARVFGENTYAGAINIVTRIPENNAASAGLAAGEFKLFGVNSSATFGNRNLRNHLSFNHSKSDGYRYNSDYRISNIFWQSEIFTTAGNIDLLAGYSDRDFGANGFYASPDHSDQYEAVETGIFSMGFTPNLKSYALKLNSRFYWRHNSDEYLFLRYDPDYYRNIHKTNVTGFDINLTWHNRFGITGLGLDAGIAAISSSRLGNHNRNVFTLFAEHRFSLADKRLSLTPGVQFSYYSNFGSNILPGIDIGYNFNKETIIFISSGVTYRVPTYTDLFYEDPANSSNPALKPEYAFSNEFGIRNSSIYGVSYQFNIFSRLSSNLIDRVKYNSEDKWVPENITRTSTSGFDTEIKVEPRVLFNIKSVPISYMKFGYTYINATVTDAIYPYSRFEFDNLRHHIVAKISFDYPCNIYHQIAFRYYDRITLDNYSLLDSRLGFRNKNWDIFLDVVNILNTDYTETNLVPMPGRWFTTGIVFSLTKSD